MLWRRFFRLAILLAPMGTVTCESTNETARCPSERFGKSSGCTLCLPGEFSQGGRGHCERCKAGRYSSQGAQGCSPCLDGEFSLSGSARCLECRAGKASNKARDGCVTCAAGKYSEGGGQCLTCDAGRYSVPGSAHCHACAVGRFSSAGSANCTASCAAGTEGEQGSCRACEAGRFSSSGGPCEACAPGMFSPQGATRCTSCPSGMYTEAAASSSCKACPAGHSSSGVACHKCPAGKAGERCDWCPPGTFSGSDAITCSPCASGSYSRRGSTSCSTCAPGTIWNASRSRCEPCSPGHFGEAGQCFPCPRGTVSPYPGRGRDCDKCRAGEGTVDARRCDRCPPGSFGADGVCHACTGGDIAPSPGMASCSSCPSGWTSGANRTSCVECEGGQCRGVRQEWLVVGLDGAICASLSCIGLASMLLCATRFRKASEAREASGAGVTEDPVGCASLECSTAQDDGEDTPVSAGLPGGALHCAEEKPHTEEGTVSDIHAENQHGVAHQDMNVQCAAVTSTCAQHPVGHAAYVRPFGDSLGTSETDDGETSVSPCAPGPVQFCEGAARSRDSPISTAPRTPHCLMTPTVAVESFSISSPSQRFLYDSADVDSADSDDLPSPVRRESCSSICRIYGDMMLSESSRQFSRELMLESDLILPSKKSLGIEPQQLFGEDTYEPPVDLLLSSPPLSPPLKCTEHYIGGSDIVTESQGSRASGSDFADHG